jgi:hypothetical protein
MKESLFNDSGNRLLQKELLQAGMLTIASTKSLRCDRKTRAGTPFQLGPTK